MMPIRLDPQCTTGNSLPEHARVQHMKHDGVLSSEGAVVGSSEGDVAHLLCSLMKINFFLCSPETASVVFWDCSQE